MKIAIVVGTRPEVIKMSPVIRACQIAKVSFIIIHSNQHYSENMDAIFFEQLELPQPDYNLEVGSGTHGNQIGNILIKMEPILEKEQPNVVLVQGDTNTVAAAAMLSSKLNIRLGHIEAGLRSYDRRMPEETNRIMTDHLSDFLFAVSKVQSNILIHEGINKERIFTVGNTIVDAVSQNIKLAESKSSILDQLNVAPQDYVLFTAHRASNVDDIHAFREVLQIIDSIPETVVWPMHLRSKKKLESFQLSLPSNVLVTEPLGYFDFLSLEKHASLIVTDSGGLQEEACILKVPCITIRENTERPETIDVGANKLVGRNLKKFSDAYKYWQSSSRSWENPFGDGSTANKILQIITGNSAQLSNREKPERICVIGLGYMGLPTAALFANAGYSVTGVDVNPKKVEQVNFAICPFDEPGMDELIKTAIDSKRLTAQTQTPKADIYILAVPTPHDNGKCDLRFVKQASEQIAKVTENNSLVIVESTIRPRTCLDVIMPIFKSKQKDIHLAHCPERAIPGNTLNELIHNDRIIGGINHDTNKKVQGLYKSFVKGEIFTTDVTTAECVKLMENTFRDVNIAFANEVSDILESFDVNPWEAISLANRHPRVNILNPGPGVGGHCIAVDPWFLLEGTEHSELIRQSRKINDARPYQIADKTRVLANKHNAKKVGILGLAYKKDVDDCRESPSFEIIKALDEMGFETKAADPHVRDVDFDLLDTQDLIDWADVLVLTTDHTIFLNYKITKPILDTRNLFR